ncbi:MAG: aminopeptidase P family protein [Ignavibacteriae bacterium HGW-Ignavibacteriae-3]|nr:MAG: aminopeptidase P family protein [Ignavibacteriae bacterium HGW-Ignavibacteriae-3]
MLIKEKVEQAKKLLDEFDVDCWLTFARETQINGDPALSFLVDADLTWHSSFIITRNEAHAVVGEYDRLTVEELGVYNSVTGFVKGFKEPLLSILKKLNPSTIAINYSIGSEICDGLTYGMYLTLQSVLSEISFDKRLVSGEKIVSALRERKSETETKNIKLAIRHTEEIFDLVAKFIKPGKTEKEIASFMKSEVEKRKLEFAWEEKVCPAVFTGPENAGAHYAPTDRKVEKAHILNMDFGVKVNGYCSDMQRTYYILDQGEASPPASVQKGFSVIVDAIEKSKLGIKPGVQGHMIDKIARETITKNGYDEYPFGLGHQVGRFSHDGTALLGPAWEKYAQKPFQNLEPGMVFTIEPRLTVPGHGIVSIEEMIIITESGSEWLTNPQKSIILI